MLNRKQQPAIQPIEPFIIPSPEQHVMPNGIPLNCFHTGDEEVVRLDFLIHGGSWNQSRPLQSAFTNRMLREGTHSYTSAQIAEKLDYYGSWLHLSASSHYSFLTIFSLNKYFSKTIDIVRSLLMEPLFPERELAIAIEKSKQQFKVNNSKVDILARRELNRSLYGTQHPAGIYAIEKDYDVLDREALISFHRQFYHSGNCTIYISGKVTPEIIQTLEKTFGQSPWGEISAIPEIPDWIPQPNQEKRIVIERDDAMQNAIDLGCLTIDRRHPDYPKLRVLITLFGGYFGSRLMTNIREEKGYTYGIGSSLSAYPKGAIMIIGTQATSEYTEPIIQEVYHEIDRLQNEPVPEEELSMVKSYMMGETCRSYEGPFSLADAYIYLQSGELNPEYTLRTQRAIIETTASDIQHLAITYLQKEEMKEIIAGKMK